jgi:hypothetical protein
MEENLVKGRRRKIPYFRCPSSEELLILSGRLG